MASVDLEPTKVCKKCGQPQITRIVDGDTEETVFCLECDAPQNGTPLRNDLADPGAEAMEAILRGAKVASLAEQVSPPQRVTLKHETVHYEPRAATLPELLDSVLYQLKGCPMPKDIKQFKNIQKAVQLLQKTLEEENV